MYAILSIIERLSIDTSLVLHREDFLSALEGRF